MADESTVVAAPSATAVETTIELPRSGTPEYADWRVSGKLPEKTQPKTADPAPAAKETPSVAGAPDTPTKQQEHTEKRRKPDAEERIKQLTEERNRWKAEAEAAKVAKPAEQSKPDQQAPQNYAEWRKGFKPAEWMAEYAKKNPEASYEDSSAAMADHLGEAREYFRQAESQQQATKREIDTKMADARTRYENFDEVLTPTLNAIVGDQAVSPAVKAMLNDSEVLPDLLFTLGNDAAELKAFLAMAKTNPGKALRYVAHVENLIQEELAGTAETAGRDSSGKFVAKAEPVVAPVKRGPESAPEPPLEVGNRGVGPLDASEKALSALKSGNSRAFRDYMAAENAKELRRRRGA